MNSAQKRQRGAFIARGVPLWPLLAASVGALAAAFPEPLYLLGGVSMLVGSVAFALFAKPVVLGVLLSRTSLDAISASSIGIAGFSKDLNVTGAVAVLVALGGALYATRWRTRVLAFPVTPPFLAFFSVGVLSTLVSSDRSASIVELIRLASYFTISVVLAVSTRRWVDLKRVIIVIAGASVVPCLVGLYQVLFSQVTLRRVMLPRATGTLGSGPAFATFLMMPLMVSIVYSFEARGPQRIFWTLFVLFQAVLFLFTFSRAAWAGLIIATLIIGVLKYRKVALLILTASVLVGITVPAVRVRLTDLGGAFTDPASERSTLPGRLALWRAAIELFSTSPMIGTGLGVGSLQAGEVAFDRPYHVHNDYLRVLVDTGIAGIVAFVWLLLAMGWVGLRAYRCTTVPLLRGLAAGYLAVWVAFLAVRFWGNVATHTTNQYYFWAVAGLVHSLPGIERRQG